MAFLARLIASRMLSPRVLLQSAASPLRYQRHAFAMIPLAHHPRTTPPPPPTTTTTTTTTTPTTTTTVAARPIAIAAQHHQAPRRRLHTLMTTRLTSSTPHSSIHRGTRSFATSTNFDVDRLPMHELPLSDAQRELPSFKKLTKMFYSLVHPDLFGAIPHAQDVNSHSMREFILLAEQWTKRPEGATYARVIKRTLPFYIRPQHRTGTSGEPLNESELKRVEATIVINAPFTTVKASFQSLFIQCGLPGDFYMASGGQVTDANDIEAFLGKNVVMARQRAENIKELESLIEDSINRLAHQHQVNVDSLSLEDESPHENYLLVNVLESVLSTIKRETPSRAQALRGVRLYLEADTMSNTIDLENGAIHLHRTLDVAERSRDHVLRRLQEKEHEWLLFLGNPLLEVAELQRGIQFRRAHMQKLELDEKRRKQKVDTYEQEASSALGILAVNQTPEYEYYEVPLHYDQVMSEELARALDADESLNTSLEEETSNYAAFVETLAENKKLLRNSRKKELLKRFRKLALYVRSLPSGQRFVINARGMMFVSPKCTPLEVVKLIEEHGTKALQLERENDEWENVRQFVMARLGLEGLGPGTHFAAVEPDAINKERQALARLRDNADQLRTLGLSGLMLAISDRYAIGSDGSLFIKHDFSIEEVKKLLLPARDSIAS